jgi:hypothetical protein
MPVNDLGIGYSNFDRTKHDRSPDGRFVKMPFKATKPIGKNLSLPELTQDNHNIKPDKYGISNSVMMMDDCTVLAVLL